MYQVFINGEPEDELFETEEEAIDHGLYLESCASMGADILHMSNPGDYPFRGDELYDDEDEYFEVVNVGEKWKEYVLWSFN